VVGLGTYESIENHAFGRIDLPEGELVIMICIQIESSNQPFTGKELSMKIVLNIIGVLIGLMGLVWFLQGINVLQGSSLMSGQTQWAVIGAVALVVGIGLIFFANRRKSTPPV